jgi:hypothetical protein
LKGKKKATSPAEPRNEGIDQSNWDYKPPKGAVLIDCEEEDAGQFDWDAVKNNEEVELCLIRIPKSVTLSKRYPPSLEYSDKDLYR